MQPGTSLPVSARNPQICVMSYRLHWNGTVKYDLQLRQLKIRSRDKYKVYGELINTYGYNVAPGEKKLEALNYYTNEIVSIPLDPVRTPQENAQRIAKYNKQKRTLKH